MDMRIIKFRGKRLDDPQQWEYGYYQQDETDAWMHTLDGRVLRIIPDTLGQFTGLHDKNGHEIYEGDILRSPSGNIVAVEFGYKEHTVKHGRPYITDSFACYGWIARNAKNGITDFFDNEFAAGEVVGNIHEPQKED